MGITSRMAGYHGANGRIKGAQKTGNMWVVPMDAPKPDDLRKKNKEVWILSSPFNFQWGDAGKAVIMKIRLAVVKWWAVK